jgi:hypothetical protein
MNDRKSETMDTSLGKIFLTCRRGYSHILKKTPCQDSGKYYESSDKFRIIAVADGHGHKSHDLSEIGSRIAAEKAIEVLNNLIDKFEDEKLLYDALKIDFPKIIAKEWKEGVVSDFIEKSNVSDSDIPFEEIMKRYGTTLLAAILTPKYLYLLQLGDGDILLIDENDQIESITAANSELVGETTYSLSQVDSSNFWQVSKRTKPIKGLLTISTDGFSKSFISDEEFQKVSLNLYAFFKSEGYETTVGYIPTWLDEYSRNGSQDDITLGLAYFS